MKLRNFTIEDGGGENPGLLGCEGILDHIGTLLDDDSILKDGKSITITISRYNMTREEINALPEI